MNPSTVSNWPYGDREQPARRAPATVVIRRLDGSRIGDVSVDRTEVPSGGVPSWPSAMSPMDRRPVGTPARPAAIKPQR